MFFLKNNPKVSIIIVCYNSEKFIQFAIESIKKQEYKNWELIIINDCSNDLTKEILKKNKYKKIKIINLKKNVGPYKATNLALKKATGKYVAILDSDDYSHSKRISSQVFELEKNPKIGLVLTKYKLINEKNKIIKNIGFISEKDFNKRFPCENLACNSSAMFRKKFVEDLTFYNSNYFYSYDYNFFLKIFAVSKIKLINKFYTFYRIHENQRTNKLKEKIILKENISHLFWSMNNGLININNLDLFLKRFIILNLKLLFGIFRLR